MDRPIRTPLISGSVAVLGKPVRASTANPPRICAASAPVIQMRDSSATLRLTDGP